MSAVKNPVEIFTLLGERLYRFGEDEGSRTAIAAAVAENPWFTESEIRFAVEALRCDMLQEDKLRSWLSSYDFGAVQPKRVGIIMAGNIPLVGFFDLLCVVASGHTTIVKPSGKDRVLMRYIVEQLRDIEPEIAVFECSDDIPDAASVDAVIATGNDNARRLFKSVYADKPQLLRGSRHSVAVLSGCESAAELEGLQRDMFCYSGLGCRNVSMLFVPVGFRPQLSGCPSNPKFFNNYTQTKALLEMRGETFSDSGCCLLVSGDDFSPSISCIAVREYTDVSEVSAWLADHDDELQCVVTELISHPRRVGFGLAQRPQLTDWPDAVDVLAFLRDI